MNPTIGGPLESGLPLVGEPMDPPIAPPPQERSERSLAELLSSLVGQVGTLVRKEIELAKTELTAKATRVLQDAAMIGAGAALTLLSVVVLLAALILGLGTFMPLWSAALLVGVVFAVVGIGLVMTGVAALKKIDPLPRATVETFQEDRKWVEQMTHR